MFRRLSETADIVLSSETVGLLHETGLWPFCLLFETVMWASFLLSEIMVNVPACPSLMCLKQNNNKKNLKN